MHYSFKFIEMSLFITAVNSTQMLSYSVFLIFNVIAKKKQYYKGIVYFVCKNPLVYVSRTTSITGNMTVAIHDVKIKTKLAEFIRDIN